MSKLFGLLAVALLALSTGAQAANLLEEEDPSTLLAAFTLHCTKAVDQETKDEVLKHREAQHLLHTAGPIDAALCAGMKLAADVKQWIEEASKEPMPTAAERQAAIERGEGGSTWRDRPEEEEEEEEEGKGHEAGAQTGAFLSLSEEEVLAHQQHAADPFTYDGNWPFSTLRYYFADSPPRNKNSAKAQVYFVLGAVQMSKETNLNVIPGPKNLPVHKLRVVTTKNECSSVVGNQLGKRREKMKKQKKKVTNIDLKKSYQSLTNGHYCGPGSAQHEIMHALGFDHTQARLDRDAYIEVVWDNIEEDEKYNFARAGYEYKEGTGEIVDKDETYNYADFRKSVYEYGSVMHYGPRSFGKKIKKKKKGEKKAAKGADDAEQKEEDGDEDEDEDATEMITMRARKEDDPLSWKAKGLPAPLGDPKNMDGDTLTEQDIKMVNILFSKGPGLLDPYPETRTMDDVKGCLEIGTGTPCAVTNKCTHNFIVEKATWQSDKHKKGTKEDFMVGMMDSAILVHEAACLSGEFSWHLYGNKDVKGTHFFGKERSVAWADSIPGAVIVEVEVANAKKNKKKDDVISPMSAPSALARINAMREDKSLAVAFIARDRSKWNALRDLEYCAKLVQKSKLEGRLSELPALPDGVIATKVTTRVKEDGKTKKTPYAVGVYRAKTVKKKDVTGGTVLMVTWPSEHLKQQEDPVQHMEFEPMEIKSGE